MPARARTHITALAEQRSDPLGGLGVEGGLGGVVDLDGDEDAPGDRGGDAGGLDEAAAGDVHGGLLDGWWPAVPAMSRTLGSDGVTPHRIVM